MKTFRVFRDIKAKNKEDAIRKLEDAMETEGQLGTSITGNGCLFRIQEGPLNDEEEGIVLELAHMALADGEVYDAFANRLDISDKELKKLQKKIEKVTNRP